MLGKEFVEKSKVLHKMGWQIRGDLTYGNYLVAIMNYNDKALYLLFKSTFNKDAAMSIELMGKGKIKVTIRSLRKDHLNSSVMDALIHTGPLYSDYFS